MHGDTSVFEILSNIGGYSEISVFQISSDISGYSDMSVFEILSDIRGAVRVQSSRYQELTLVITESGQGINGLRENVNVETLRVDLAFCEFRF